MLCSLRRGTRTPICSVSSTDRARILAGCLICCSICAGHTRSQTWRSTSLFFASPPSAESALAAVLSLCHAVSCLAVCVLLCRLPYRHLTCTAGIDTTITAILKYTTIPANKGAEGAVSVTERAVNEAALGVSLVCLMVCLCVVVFLWCSARASPATSLVAALVLCSLMRAWRVLGVRCGKGRCHVRPRRRPRLTPAG